VNHHQRRSSGNGTQPSATLPIDAAANRLIYTIGRFDRALRTELNRTLAPLQLTMSEFTILAVLRRRSGLSNAQLARRAMVSAQTMSQTLISLEQRGLVRRPAVAGTEAHAHHRARAVRLTAAGERLVDASEQAVAEVGKVAFNELAPEHWGALTATLRHATEALRSLPPTTPEG